jgi:hypothetical protein
MSKKKSAGQENRFETAMINLKRMIVNKYEWGEDQINALALSRAAHDEPHWSQSLHRWSDESGEGNSVHRKDDTVKENELIPFQIEVLARKATFDDDFAIIFSTSQAEIPSTLITRAHSNRHLNSCRQISIIVGERSDFFMSEKTTTTCFNIPSTTVIRT